MLAVVGLALAPGAALAQARPPARPAAVPARAPLAVGETRGFLTIGAGGQFGTARFSETHRKAVNAEDEIWTADYSVRSGIELEGGGGWRVWRNLFAGGMYTYSRHDASAPITGTTPHPFFFNQPREISGESPALSHSEQAIHISAIWNIPVGRRLELGVLGGPSVLRLSRELVQTVEYTETFPYDTVTFSRATVGDARTTKVGLHAGVSLAWPLTPRIGLGAMIRYTSAKADLATPSGGSAAFDIGGLQTAIGLRFGFLSKSPARVPPRVTPPVRRR